MSIFGWKLSSPINVTPTIGKGETGPLYLITSLPDVIAPDKLIFNAPDRGADTPLCVHSRSKVRLLFSTIALFDPGVLLPPLMFN